MPIIEIKKYDAAYYAGAKNAARYPYRAIIGLRDENNSLLGAAYFHRDSATLPVTDTRKSSGYISCHYLAEDYPQVLDLLRNEKPVYVEFDVHLGNMANIRTSAEPVGEGEHDQSTLLGSYRVIAVTSHLVQRAFVPKPVNINLNGQTHDVRVD